MVPLPKLLQTAMQHDQIFKNLLQKALANRVSYKKNLNSSFLWFNNVDKTGYEVF